MTIKQQYVKERRRIQRFMRSAEKRGFIFEEDLLPAIPKRITRASIRRLSNIRPDFLYAHAYYIRPETAEAIPAKDRLVEVKTAAKTKRRATLAMKKQRVQQGERASARVSTVQEEQPTDTPYYPPAEHLGYERLMTILQTAYGSFNSVVMRAWVRDYVNRFGLIDFVRILATEEGKQAIREAEEIAYDSDGDRARRWGTHLENLFMRNGLVSEDELKQFQGIRQMEAWE